MHEFIHGGELNDDFTALLDEGVKQRFVTSTRNVRAFLAVRNISAILLHKLSNL